MAHLQLATPERRLDLNYILFYLIKYSFQPILLAESKILFKQFLGNVKIKSLNKTNFRNYVILYMFQRLCVNGC